MLRGDGLRWPKRDVERLLLAEFEQQCAAPGFVAIGADLDEAGAGLDVAVPGRFADVAAVDEDAGGGGAGGDGEGGAHREQVDLEQGLASGADGEGVDVVGVAGFSDAQGVGAR